MTWKEFKEEMELLGFKDDDEIWFIDIQGGERLQLYKPRDNKHDWKAVTSY